MLMAALHKTTQERVKRMKIYVGNLSYDTDNASLKAAFERFGAVDDARVVEDKYTQRSRGFGFVEMSNDSEAKTAIAELNNTDLQGRTITVNEARPREDRDRGGSRGGGGGGSRGGGGGGGRSRY
ncbi:MAG: hypothetical protein QG656_463 [Candidatus Hydrogenedentes bacterium]|nr:hypothetical protein [Candidatus Hydrogenedentota bacterium]